MKVEIFERKVESYKTMTDQLGDAMEYIRVRLLDASPSTLRSKTTCLNSLFILNAVSSGAGRGTDQERVSEAP